ncbi:MAG: twitching motility protein PilT [Thaumarchaeota archaeon]|nr:twitching motility protein PilT [Nitrososphaerota archaeon]
MVDVICDTSFLIHLATTRVKNLDSLDVEIGHLEFVVPQVVRNELEALKEDPTKATIITATLNFIKNFKTIPIQGTFADPKLVDYVKTNRCMVATLDRKLKKQIKSNGGSVMSFSRDRIVI